MITVGSRSGKIPCHFFLFLYLQSHHSTGQKPVVVIQFWIIFYCSGKKEGVRIKFFDEGLMGFLPFFSLKLFPTGDITLIPQNFQKPQNGTFTFHTKWAVLFVELIFIGIFVLVSKSSLCLASDKIS